MPSRGSRVRRVFLDTEPLRRDRDLRWLWNGQAISGIGNRITRLALAYQVYALTGSTLAIAGLILFQLVPILIFSLGAGSIIGHRRPSPRRLGTGCRTPAPSDACRIAAQTLPERRSAAGSYGT